MLTRIIQRPIDVYLQSLLALDVWSSTTITFSFPSKDQYSGYENSDPDIDFTYLVGDAQRDAIRAVFAHVSQLTNLTFVEISGQDAGDALIRVGRTNETETAYAYYPSEEERGGDVWLGIGSELQAQGSYDYFALLHEVGHALGLSHPHEPETGPPMPLDRDYILHTVMSYRSGEGAEPNGYTNSYFPRTFMPVDIAALQYAYGANYTTNSGDTVYQFGVHDTLYINGELVDWGESYNNLVMTIWDGGGIDTYDFSLVGVRSFISLEPGAISSVSDTIANAFLFEGNPQSLIENAIGFGTIVGNIADNRLEGRYFEDELFGMAGNDHLIGNEQADKLYGGEGDDILEGGANDDWLYGGTGNDIYYVDNFADLVFEDAGAGEDQVFSKVDHYLYSNVENLTLEEGAGDIFGVGNELDNTLTGNEGKNLLIAGAGDDTAHGGAARDSIFGESGADMLFGEAGIDYLVGGAGNDTIDGGDDSDEIYGQDGNDTLIGGSSFHTDILVGGDGNDMIHGDGGLGDYDLLYGNLGDDLYYVDTPADLVFEQADEGTDTVVARIEGAGYYLYDGIENLVLEGSTPFGVGNALANTLTGSDAANWLLGGDGDDVLNGKGGGDVLFGEAGADTFVFEHGTGGDVIGDFQHGVDTIDLTAWGFESFAALAAVFLQNGNVGAIDLGNGDFIVLHNVVMEELTADDFLL